MRISKGKIIGLIISFATCIILIASGILVLNPGKEEGGKNPSSGTSTLQEGTVYEKDLNGSYEVVQFTASYTGTYYLFAEGCAISSVKSSSETISLTNYSTNYYKNGTYYDYKYSLYLKGGKTYTIKTTSSYSEIMLYIY